MGLAKILHPIKKIDGRRSRRRRRRRGRRKRRRRRRRKRRRTGVWGTVLAA